MAKDDAEDEAPAAVEGEGDGLEGEGGGKKSKKKLIIMVVAGLVILLAAGGAGLYFTGKLDKMLGKAPAEGTAEAGEHIDEAKAKDDCKKAKKEEKKEGGGHGKKEEGGGGGGGCGEAVFLEIPNMLVNLSGPDDQPRYLRLKVQLELANDDDLSAVKAVLPRVVDQFQTYLRELRIKDLRGSAGIYRLQMELLSRVNAAAYPTEVKDVLFQEILIQ